MGKIKYYAVQDGTEVNKSIKDKFNKSLSNDDTRDNDKKWNFVGFIMQKNEMLVSFPKHYFSQEELSEINYKLDESNIYVKSFEKKVKLLFKTIQKGNKKIENKNKRLGHLKENQEECTPNIGYPFKAYFGVYDYFKRFGLYHDENIVKKFGYKGNIHWKDTIRKSNTIFSEDNVIFMPLVIKERLIDEVFITHSMAYVIDSTLEKFRAILDGKRTGYKVNPNEFKSEKAVIARLRKIKEKTFKDVYKKLIDNLIDFFENVETGTKKQCVKIYNFNSIWEDIIETYLEEHFEKIIPLDGISDLEKDIKHYGIVKFTKEKCKNQFRKTIFKIDSRSGVDRTLEPDHYWFDEENKTRYIFDSKYKDKMDTYDEKQLQYHYSTFMFKNAKKNGEPELIDFDGRDVKIHNVAFVPTHEKSYTDIALFKPAKYTVIGMNIVLLNHFVNLQEVMNIYMGVKEYSSDQGKNNDSNLIKMEIDFDSGYDYGDLKVAERTSQYD